MYHNNEKLLQERFVTLLKEKRPKNLVNALLEVLPLEKEAIYRRLRGEVPFSFVEMATLSTRFGISLDNITNLVSPYRSQWYQLHVRDYCEFTAIDLNMSYNYVKVINMAADNPYSEFGIAANMLPLHISLLHPAIYRVYILKWRYQFSLVSKEELVYSKTQVPKDEEKTYHMFLNAVKRIKYTYFIWDSSFFVSLINDINYLHNIGAIGPEDMVMLKREMGCLLETLESYADNGVYASTGNRVETYVSNLNFETTYSYLSSDDISVSMSSAYCLGAFTSLERSACDEMRTWIQSLKKGSTFISGAAQREKMIFFEKQRAFLENSFIINEKD